MTTPQKIAKYCLLQGANRIDENLEDAYNHILMAKHCLNGDLTMAHRLNVFVKDSMIDKWMSEWYLETIKQELQ